MSWKQKTPRPNWTRGCDRCSSAAEATGGSRRMTASQLRIGGAASFWGWFGSGRCSWFGGGWCSWFGSGRCNWFGGRWCNWIGGGRCVCSMCSVCSRGGDSWWGGDWRSRSWLATDEQGQRQQSEVLLHGNLPQSSPRSLCRVERRRQFRPMVLSSRETHVLSCGLSNSRERVEQKLFPENGGSFENTNDTLQPIFK